MSYISIKCLWRPLVLLCALQVITGSSYGQSVAPPAPLAASATRMLVVGGGGARGAWGGGFVQHLVAQAGAPYQVVFGTSTGSLMAPLIVLNDFAALKQAYTSVEQKDIFNLNPFNTTTGNLRPLNAAWRALRGQPSFGESKNLRTLIDKFLTKERYEQIRNSASKLEFVVCVVDMKSSSVSYRSSRNIPQPEQMKDWMWASANEPLFMSYYNVADSAFVDGGVRENVPLTAAYHYARAHGINQIDVVINKPLDPLVDKTFPNRSVLNGLLRLVDIWNLEVRNDDLLIPRLMAMAGAQRLMAAKQLNRNAADQTKNFTINLHFFPSELYYNHPLAQKELLFDRSRMLDWWTAGEAGQEDGVAPVTAKNASALASPMHSVSLPIDLLDELLK